MDNGDFRHEFNQLEHEIDGLDFQMKNWNTNQRRLNWTGRITDANDLTGFEAFAVVARNIETRLRHTVQILKNMMQLHTQDEEGITPFQRAIHATQKLIHTSLIFTNQPNKYLSSAGTAEKTIRIKSLLFHYRFGSVSPNGSGTQVVRCCIIDEPIAEMVATSSTGDITEEQVAFKFNNVVSETQDFNNNQYEIVFREFAEMTRFHAAGFHRLSNPFILTTNVSLYHDAWSTLLWDVNFAPLHRTPFAVPAEVSWLHFIEAIDNDFSNAGRRLSDQNKEYLKTKLATRSTDGQDVVTRDRFCNETPLKFVISGERKDVTLANWLFNILKLLMNPPPVILREWIENKVTGFISTSELEAALTASAVGTFMIRFSENVKGAVTMQFKVQRQDNSVGLAKFGPFTEAMLRSHNSSLGYIIRTCPQLRILYPDIRVEEAFPIGQDQLGEDDKILVALGYKRNQFNL
ncbi:Signal transducer and transcription activator [Folsomia candida]|uniref:Signal transducer and transcription activator n=1 Tax=Folsomia candida TaxID=158441 RepID=A0A226E0W4_FOLCA|nr:Signal transducer and transcription activator [Folsomia candida]